MFRIVNKYIRPMHRRLQNQTEEEVASNAARRFRGNLSNPQMRVLTAKDGSTGQVVGVSIWIKPLDDSEEKPNPANEAKKNDNVDVELDPESYKRFRDALAEKGKQTMGDRKHWSVEWSCKSCQ